MVLKNAKQGKTVKTLKIDEKLHVTETMVDKDLLLYLGLTNDNNPLFIQHEYTAKTVFKHPIVPQIMLNGIITSTISKHLPGPGSYIKRQTIKYLAPVYHDETIDFIFQVSEIDIKQNDVTISVVAKNLKNEKVIEGVLKVAPPSLK